MAGSSTCVPFARGIRRIRFLWTRGSSRDASAASRRSRLVGETGSGRTARRDEGFAGMVYFSDQRLYRSPTACAITATRYLAPLKTAPLRADEPDTAPNARKAGA